VLGLPVSQFHDVHDGSAEPIGCCSSFMSASILNVIGGKSSYYNFEVPVSCLSNRRKRNRRCIVVLY
jgi:hypothetical protein